MTSDDSSVDLLEQQQAREQSRLLDRFKQLREMQVRQQETLMRQQQQQLLKLKEDQEKVQMMIAKQRQMQWGASPQNGRSLLKEAVAANTCMPMYMYMIELLYMHIHVHVVNK